jgi:ankyrin repeat protein
MKKGLAATLLGCGLCGVIGSADLLVSAQVQRLPGAQVSVDYDRDVKPLLAQSCYSCHGAQVQQAGLRLDLRQNALRGGDYGPVIIPGKSGESKLIRRVVDGDGGLQMPPSGPLSPDEIQILRAWIDQGAEFRTEIAETALPTPIDPKLAELIRAARSFPRPMVERLATDHVLVNSKDPAGSTPLHHAAGFGGLDTLAFLLDAGADVNARNRNGSTPLHWAIHDEAKVRLLLSRGAAIDIRQMEGRTPLYQAASLGNGHTVLRMLLQKRADANVPLANGRTPLMAAAARGDVEAMTLLLDAKAKVDARDGAGETALMLAATAGNPQAVRLLLDRGADARARTKRNETALGNAGSSGVEETVRLLLVHGADVNVRNIHGYSPLMLAASSDAIPAGVVELLLAHGADTRFTGDYDETARDLAAKRGDTTVARLLGGAPKRPAGQAVPSHGGTVAPSIADAVERALVLTAKQSFNFIRIAGCNSCHSQDLPSAAAAFARGRGLRAPREIPQLPPSMTATPERVMDFGILGVVGLAWELFDLGMNGEPRNDYTDAAVRLIAAMQTQQGHWSANQGRRPPMTAGDHQLAGLAIYALKQYTPEGGDTSSERAIASAVGWLQRSQPQLTQDRAFHALALAWAGGHADSARRSAQTLVAMQRPDGGWSQLPGTDSDAYATGQALYALHVAGKMPATDPVYHKGVAYLLRTQATDGTWHVRSRAIWLQPYFESGFPYGHDQWISQAATAWATIGLARAAAE